MSKEDFTFQKSNPWAPQPTAPSVDNSFLASPAPPSYGQPLYSQTPSTTLYPPVHPPVSSDPPHRPPPPTPHDKVTSSSFGIPGLKLTVSERPGQSSFGISVGGLVGALLGTGKQSSTMHLNQDGVRVETVSGNAPTQVGPYGSRLPAVPQPYGVQVSGTMPLFEFVAALDKVKAAYFEKGRFEQLGKLAGSGARFDCQQLSAILDALKHQSERLKAIEMFGPLIIDTHYNGVKLGNVEKVKEYDELAMLLAKFGIRIVK